MSRASEVDAFFRADRGVPDQIACLAQGRTANGRVVADD